MTQRSITDFFSDQFTTEQTQNKLDIRNSPSINITRVLATSIAEPKPYHSLVAFEEMSNGKYKPIFSDTQTGYELRAIAPSPDDITKDKFVKLVVPTLEIAKKLQFRGLYNLKNPKGKKAYKSFDVLEIYAEDVEPVRIQSTTNGGQ
jgi:hypothetical protein